MRAALLTLALITADIAHSLTIDACYGNLQIEDGCRQMRGELVVRPRR